MEQEWVPSTAFILMKFPSLSFLEKVDIYEEYDEYKDLLDFPARKSKIAHKLDLPRKIPGEEIEVILTQLYPTGIQ